MTGDGTFGKHTVIGKNFAFGNNVKISDMSKIGDDVTLGNDARDDILAENIRLIPEAPPKPRHMSWTLNDLGPKPVIDLHTGGLKVGEIMARLRKAGHSPKDIRLKAIQNDLAQDFSEDKYYYGGRR